MRSYRITWLMAAGLAATACTRPVTPPESAGTEVEPGAAAAQESAVPGNAGATRTGMAASVRAVHTVRRGDTLYSIAWRYGLDVRDLVAWNGVSDPNLILVGQGLYVAPEVAAAPAARPPTGRTADGSTPLRGLDSPWQWPASGPLVSRFGAAEGLGGGIGIGGELGSPVRAAASGEVVYAGGGLAVYGNLVILRHDATFLSAYGHNSEILAAEGDRVAQGQPIATMGLGPGRRPQVHFEIRRNGTPVDPMVFLPD